MYLLHCIYEYQSVQYSAFNLTFNHLKILCFIHVQFVHAALAEKSQFHFLFTSLKAGYKKTAQNTKRADMLLY